VNTNNATRIIELEKGKADSINVKGEKEKKQNSPK